MVTKDRVFSISMLMLCVILYLETYNFREGSTLRVAPETFPRIIIIVIFVLTLFNLIRSIITHKAEPLSIEQVVFFKRYGKVIVLFVFFGLYVYLMSKLNFVVAALIFMFASQAVFTGVWKMKPVVTNLITTFVSVYTIYFVFTNVLKIWLP
jgi:putative tricarboxylic transport membrane protein